MTRMREELAFTLWKNEAQRAAPNVARSRDMPAFRDQSDETRDRWLNHADAIIAALPGMVKPLEWGTDYLEELAETSAYSPFGRYFANGNAWWGPGVIISTGSGQRSVSEQLAEADMKRRCVAAFGLPEQELTE